MGLDVNKIKNVTDECTVKTLAFNSIRKMNSVILKTESLQL